MSAFCSRRIGASPVNIRQPVMRVSRDVRRNVRVFFKSSESDLPKLTTMTPVPDSGVTKPKKKSWLSRLGMSKIFRKKSKAGTEADDSDESESLSGKSQRGREVYRIPSRRPLLFKKMHLRFPRRKTTRSRNSVSLCNINQETRSVFGSAQINNMVERDMASASVTPQWSEAADVISTLSRANQEDETGTTTYIINLPIISPFAVHHCAHAIVLRAQRACGSNPAGTLMLAAKSKQVGQLAESVLHILSKMPGLCLADGENIPKQLHRVVIERMYEELLSNMGTPFDLMKAFNAGAERVHHAFAQSFLKAMEDEDLESCLFCPPGTDSLCDENESDRTDEDSVEKSTSMAILLLLKLLANGPPHTLPPDVSPQKLMNKVLTSCTEALSGSVGEQIEKLYQKIFVDLCGQVSVGRLFHMAYASEDWGFDDDVIAPLTPLTPETDAGVTKLKKKTLPSHFRAPKSFTKVKRDMDSASVTPQWSEATDTISTWSSASQEDEPGRITYIIYLNLPIISPFAVHHCAHAIVLRAQRACSSNPAGTLMLAAKSKQVGQLAESVLKVLSRMPELCVADGEHIPKKLHPVVIDRIYEELLSKTGTPFDLMKAFNAGAEWIHHAFAQSFLKAMEDEDLELCLLYPSNSDSLHDDRTDAVSAENSTSMAILLLLKLLANGPPHTLPPDVSPQELMNKLLTLCTAALSRSVGKHIEDLYQKVFVDLCGQVNVEKLFHMADTSEDWGFDDDVITSPTSLSITPLTPN
ncbi:uncharacterized protein LOC108260542 isoform X1 [Ictalurus punctatus]|uniref:Uncharacterized protein LOC108260542 isoform X1 n=1 Tax=Ictalurus punctatus TaxID=7998 RepID=A0A2D0QCK4_ICTPU|nr:uncharacterized protein LOC108260542 isoform X1 [Ictalurus punctatus]